MTPDALMPTQLCIAPKKLRRIPGHSIKIVFCAACFFISTPSALHAQPREAVFKRYTAENGLLSTHISCLWQDHRGFLWLGTGNGLYRFDGYTFKAFKRDSADTTSLSDNLIRSLYEDEFNVLWVGTLGGLNRMDRVNNRFRRYFSRTNHPTSLSHNGITCIFEDRSGRLWLGTYGGGLNQWQRANSEFKHYKSDRTNPKGLSDNIVHFWPVSVASCQGD